MDSRIALLRAARLLCLLSLLISCFSGAAAQQLEYTLAFAQPNTHLLDISIRLHDFKEPNVEVALPYWAPGVYIAEEFAQQVQDFRVETTDGTPLSFYKTDGQSWSIALGGHRDAVIHYRIYANGLFFRGAQYNEHGVGLTGAAVWMYLPHHKNLPITLHIDRSSLPNSWKIATGLTSLIAGERYKAEDYDNFADCPIEISDFRERTFTALGTKYHVVVNDTIGNQDFQQFTEKLHIAIEKGVVPLLSGAVGGPLAAPFPEYWFLIHVVPGIPGAGVEHHNSTTITLGSAWNDASDTTHDHFKSMAEYKVALAVHEFFHAWNVKRLHPIELGPFDYSRPVYTESLWISEGLTDYYTDIALLRAGLITPEEYLARISRVISAYESCPGRSERSLTESSWDTWFGFRGSGGPGTSQSYSSNLGNTTCSYYEGGHIAGFLLDLEIRHATGNQRSLDDWMRTMYQRFALPSKGFTTQDAIDVANETAGVDLEPFFRSFIKGREPFPYARDLSFAGLAIETLPFPAPWTGLELQQTGKELPVIRNVIPTSPAETAGLDRGDQLVAIDGEASQSADLNLLLAQKTVGEVVKVEVLRYGKLRQFSMRLVQDPHPETRLTRSKNITETQRAILQSITQSPVTAPSR